CSHLIACAIAFGLRFQLGQMLLYRRLEKAHLCAPNAAQCCQWHGGNLALNECRNAQKSALVLHLLGAHNAVSHVLHWCREYLPHNLFVRRAEQSLCLGPKRRQPQQECGYYVTWLPLNIFIKWTSARIAKYFPRLHCVQ